MKIPRRPGIQGTPRFEARRRRPQNPRRRVSPYRQLLASLVETSGAVAFALSVPYTAHAASTALAVDSLDQVISNLRDAIVGLLVGLATLFLTIGGIRYILAAGDPGEVEAAKRTMKYAAVGYAIAVLAPVIVGLLQSIVGTK